ILEPPPPAVLAHRRDARHHAEVGVDLAGTVAGRTRTLGVRAEQRGLDAVGLRERLADRLEQIGVRRRVAAPRAANRRLIDRDDAVTTDDRAVDQRALARAGHAGDDDEHAERDIDVDAIEVVGLRAADLHHAPRRSHRRLERRAIAQVTPG